ncbi:Transcriptional regulator [Constantimarinum furrinae]|uniref:Transcriptional regulator n=2 Tax=Constantimarinum furrinae TaxID=2562285 RepID=A0A7G8PUA7_9FLAO|nr:Transcriptional regulator [Constantimarinum furrinae]
MLDLAVLLHSYANSTRPGHGRFLSQSFSGNPIKQKGLGRDVKPKNNQQFGARGRLVNLVSCISMKTLTRKEEIIEVASQLFKEKGYNAVSMRDIALAMGIKAASLYNHISGKQELLSTLILRVAREFTLGMNSVMQSSESPLKKIERIIELHIDITVNYSEGLAALNNDWMHLENEDLESFVRMREDYEENFRQIIKQGIELGEIKSYHPEVILFSILSTLRTLYLWYQKRGKLDVNLLKREMVAVLIQGII